MNTSLAFLLIAAPAFAGPQSTDPCPGSSFEPRLTGLVPVLGSIGTNGNQIVVSQFGSYDTDGGPGGAKVFELDPATGDAVVVDQLEVAGIGRGFGREVLGAAVASSGAVLVARREPAPNPASLFQLRRSSPGGSIDVTTLESTHYISWVEDHRRFDSDGDRAVISSWVQTTNGLFVSLDFFGVNAAGDWFLEDTVRAARAAIVYNIFDVQLRGDQAVLQFFSGPARASAFERKSTGEWQSVALPSSLALTNPSEVVLSGDLLATSHVTGDSGRVDVYRRLAPGSWALTTSIPIQPTTAALNYPTNLQAAGDLLSFTIVQGPSVRTVVYRRISSGGVAFHAELNGSLLRFDSRFAITWLRGSDLVALRTNELVGSVRVCEEAGFVACDPQRAGDLSYLKLAPIGIGTDAELLLENVPAGVPAFVLASLDRVPSTGMLDSLCVGAAATMVRLPAIARTGTDGTASWMIQPDELPLASGGVISGIGGQWTFQAVVRTYAGTATSRAIVARL